MVARSMLELLRPGMLGHQVKIDVWQGTMTSVLEAEHSRW